MFVIGGGGLFCDIHRVTVFLLHEASISGEQGALVHFKWKLCTREALPRAKLRKVG